MTPFQVVAYTIAAAATAVLAVIGWRALARWAARHLEALLADALDHDPWTPMDDYLDREARLVIEHQMTDGRCDTCGTTWPCIPLRTLGITKEPA